MHIFLFMGSNHKFELSHVLALWWRSLKKRQLCEDKEKEGQFQFQMIQSYAFQGFKQISSTHCQCVPVRTVSYSKPFEMGEGGGRGGVMIKKNCHLIFLLKTFLLDQFINQILRRRKKFFLVGAPNTIW